MPIELPVCPYCGSTNIIRMADAKYDPETQTWVLDTLYEDAACLGCGSANITLTWEPQS